MNLPPQTQLGRYKIISLIGAGGMGEVYLAQDTALQRKVALKVLPPDVAANQDRMRRFKQEATSAASLNHPNIAHIYEIGEAEGFQFIAMEYVQGQTLREKIHPFVMAGYYTRLGQKEEAIAWLQKGYEERDFRMTMLAVGFGFDSIRSDPRFVELVRKMGLPE